MAKYDKAARRAARELARQRAALTAAGDQVADGPVVYLHWEGTTWYEGGYLPGATKFTYSFISSDPVVRDPNTSPADLVTLLIREAMPKAAPWSADDLRRLEAPVDGLPLPLHPGATVVIGSTGVGKTRFLSWLSAKMDWPLRDWSEPVVQSARACVPLLAGYVQRAHSGGGVIVDSLKEMLLVGSNLGKGGLSKALSKLLGDITAIAALQEGYCVFSVNPFDMDEADVPTFANSLSASTMATIHLTGATKTHVIGRMRTRMGDRQWRGFKLALDAGAESTDPPPVVHQPTIDFKRSVR